MSDLAQPLPQGQKMAETFDSSRLQKLEDEARRLREQIEVKQRAKRQGLREWDRLEREGENAQLKAELAEASLEEFSGEGDGPGEGIGGAAF